MPETFVIVGAGQAAAQVVDSLHRDGYAGRLVVVGDEPYPPYQRPPLSKKFLAGELPLERLAVKPAAFYDTAGVELRVGVRAEGLDLGARRVLLADGERLGYDRLVLATGSTPRKVQVPGHDLVGVHYLRTVADVAIVGVGVTPNTGLAAAAGLACDNGIAVDEHCRTSDPAVYAAGDCASHPSPRYGRRVRLESVDNAFEQGKTVAANLRGATLVHDRVPWFWSDQYDLKLMIVGLSHDHDEVVLRGDPASRSFACCYLKDGELLAMDCINSPKDYMAAKKLIAERVRCHSGRLADPAVPLRESVLG